VIGPVACGIAGPFSRDETRFTGRIHKVTSDLKEVEPASKAVVDRTVKEGTALKALSD